MRELPTENHETSTPDEALPSRRRVLEMLGVAAVAIPTLGLSACGGESGQGSATPAPSAPSMKDAEAVADDMAEAAKEMPAEMMEQADDAVAELQDAASEVNKMAAPDTIASDAVPRVDENGPQAMGLAYRHEAGTVDASVQPRYQAGQMCSNCVLYQGGDAPWGGCPLFAGKNVKATGWCNAYAAAS